MQPPPARRWAPAVSWVIARTDFHLTDGAYCLRGWTREEEKHWLERWVYFYWQEVFLSQKITVHPEVLHQILALSCIVESPVCFLVPCSTPRLASVIPAATRLKNPYQLSRRCQYSQVQGGAVFISVRKHHGCSCAWSLCKQRSTEN